MVLHRQRGFSLLELLVTLFVIVLVTSMASLNVGSGDRSLNLESTLRNFSHSAEFALDEAQFSATDFGLVFWLRSVEGDWLYGYEWREYREEKWRQLSADRPIFASVALPAELELELEIEDTLVGQEALTQSAGDALPQVIMYASGEVTPGAMELRNKESGDLLWRVEWDLLGQFRLLLRGEEEPDE